MGVQIGAVIAQSRGLAPAIALGVPQELRGGISESGAGLHHARENTAACLVENPAQPILR
jgi:hypothetical protein